jgi:acetyl esterase/lipase
MSPRPANVRRLLLSAFALALLLPHPTLHAQQRTEPLNEPLWPAGAPGAVGEEAADRPVFTAYRPAEGTANGTAVVVFPGGGYGRLALDHEGRQVAEWLTSLGVTAFVVQYRLGPRYRHPTMLTDAQRAVRTVRARAAEWGVHPTRVGVLGFSAGGHLASSAGTLFDGPRAGSRDPVDAVSARPDFMVLVYPVITMDDEHTHRGSRQNLLGPEPEPALRDRLSTEKQVRADTPPTFLVHTTDDAGVPVENSVLFYLAARRAGVPVEMHLFQTGPHGFGLAPTNPQLSRWPGLAAAWMARNGWIDPGVAAR